MNDRLQVLLAKQDIYELSCKYMRGLDRLDEALLVSVFFDDAWCDYGFTSGSPAQFAHYCITALQSHAANQHMIGNVLIDVEGDEAFFNLLAVFGIHEAERFCCVGNPLLEDGQVAARDAQDVGDDSRWHLRGDLGDEIDRTGVEAL